MQTTQQTITVHHIPETGQSVTAIRNPADDTYTLIYMGPYAAQYVRTIGREGMALDAALRDAAFFADAAKSSAAA